MRPARINHDPGECWLLAKSQTRRGVRQIALPTQRSLGPSYLSMTTGLA